MDRLIDREKVIKALEYCVLSDDCRPCEYWMKSDDTGCKIMKDALALLKEQEAVEPQLSISGMWYECPVCHRHLLKDRDNYCARFGRRVKWE